MKEGKKTNLMRISSINCLAIIALLLLFLLNTYYVKEAKAEQNQLVFSEENWTSENATTLDGDSSLTVNKDEHTGANAVLLHSTKAYSDFHLTYSFEYGDTADSAPWLGKSGLIIHSKESGLDGFYIGFYGWNDLLYCSTGYYIDGQFNFMFGIDANWANVAHSKNTYDIYVKDGLVNIVINNWNCVTSPLPYTSGGRITLFSDGVSGTYSDFTVQTLPQDFDNAKRAVRPNWQGYNLFADQAYWYESGKDQMFRMKLPDNIDGVESYYLARTSKVADNSQTVDVYLDLTATLSFDGEWTDKVAVWGDSYNKCTHSNALFGVNMVEIPADKFAGVQGGSEVGFYLDKNIDGWYSASEYWLLYKDKDGVLRVADYFDLAYDFDRNAHSYAFADYSSYFEGYVFICQNANSITERRRGEKVEFIGLPQISVKKNLVYEFALDEGEKTFDISEYADITDNNLGYKITYSVDGGAESDTLKLPPVSKQGKIKVSLSPDQATVDGGGWIYWDTIFAEIDYTTTKIVVEEYFNKISDIDLNFTGENYDIDLSDYVDTNVEGEWSYTLDGNEVAGSIFTVGGAYSGAAVLKLRTPSGEVKQVEINVNITAYVYPEIVNLPYYADMTLTHKKYLSLYGEVNTDGSKWISDGTANWGVMLDTGNTDYAFQSQMLIGNGGEKGKYGILVHASVSRNGYSGLIIGLYKNSSGGLCSYVGILDDGKYTELADTYILFERIEKYYIKVAVQGSSVELYVNGWRIFNFADRWNDGGKIAILNYGNEAEYEDVKIAKNDYNMSDSVFRSDWRGMDSFADSMTWNREFAITFALPKVDNAENFRLVRRTDLGNKGQNALISVNGTQIGTWSIDGGTGYGDVVFPIGNIVGDSAEITISPLEGNSFIALYAWLIYTKDGKDYIADSVYFGYDEDCMAHGLTVKGNKSGSIKAFIPIDNNALLTILPGEEAVWALDRSVLDKMQALIYSDKEISPSFDLPYRLYLPEGYDASKEYPVVLFMHGSGERGNDNVAHVVSGGTIGTEYFLNRIVFGDYKDKFIVVAPQCPADMKWVDSDWGTGNYDLNSIPQSIPSRLVQGLLKNKILKDYSVDLSKIYAVGLSMGGYGVFDLAARNPDLFAAVINCAGGADSNAYELLSTTALRAYHSAGDTNVNFEALKNLVNNMQNVGYNAEYKEVNRNGHLSWLVAFEDVDTIDWLLSNSKVWTVNVNNGGGVFTQNLPETYTKDQPEIILEDAVKEGERFVGWFTDKKFTQPITSFSGKTAKNLQLYAKFIKDCNVVIKNGDDIITSLTVQSGSSVNLGAYKPEREGYILVGFTDGNNEYSTVAEVIVNSDMVLSAKWTVISCGFIIKDGDEIVESANYDYASEVTLPVLQKDGYVLTGYSDGAKTYAVGDKITIKGDITLTAVWEVQKITVTMIVDGKSSSYEVNYGENVKLTPPETDKKFDGWYTESGYQNKIEEFTATSDITVYAKLTDTETRFSCTSGILHSGLGIISALSVAFVAVLFVKKRKQA